MTEKELQEIIDKAFADGRKKGIYELAVELEDLLHCDMNITIDRLCETQRRLIKKG